jgi:transposase-like protein
MEHVDFYTMGQKITDYTCPFCNMSGPIVFVSKDTHYDEYKCFSCNNSWMVEAE